MSRFFANSFQKLKEAVGTAEKTTEDPQAVREAKTEINALKEGNAKTTKAFKAYANGLTAEAASGEQLGLVLKEYSGQITQSSIGQVFKHIGDTQLALSALEQGLGSQVSETIVGPCKKLSETQIKRVLEMKGKQEEARVSLDVDIGKLKELQAKGADPKVHEQVEKQEQQVAMARASFDTLNQQLLNRMNGLNEGLNKDMLVHLRNYVQAQINFFIQGQHLFTELLPFIDAQLAAPSHPAAYSSSLGSSSSSSSSSASQHAQPTVTVPAVQQLYAQIPIGNISINPQQQQQQQFYGYPDPSHSQPHQPQTNYPTIYSSDQGQFFHQ